MIITVQKATNLSAGEGSKSSINPLMMITVLASGIDEEAAEAEEYPDQITQVMTAAKQNDLNPEWNETVVIPAVTGEMVILFTCVDFEGGSYTFLGQSCLRLSETGHWRQAEALTLPLAEVDDALPPRDGMGKPFEFEVATATGSAEFTVNIEPVGSDSGFCSAAKKVGGSGALATTKPPTWSKRFVALADNKLCCWEERSDPRPGLTLDMAKTESVSRPNGVRECVAIKNDTYDNQWDDNDDDVDDDVLNLMFPTPEAGDSAYALLR